MTALALLLFAGPVHAQPPEPEDPSVAQARAHFDRGRQLAEERRFAEAASAFEQSRALVPRPSTTFNLALCLFALGRHLDAIATLERFSAEADATVDESMRADAERMLAHARRSLATIELEVVPAGAVIQVDGRAIEGEARRSVQVDAGAHVVRAEAEGHAPALIELTVRSGERSVHAIQLASTRAPARLDVHVEVPSARIEINGRAAGVGDASLSLEAGEHRVRAHDPSMRDVERVVRLEWSEHRVLDLGAVALRSSSVLEEPAFWAIAGGSAAAIAVSVVLAIVLAPSPDGGSAGVVLRPQ